MSFLSQPLEQQQNLLFVNFNQDSSSLQTGSKNGFKLYPLNSVDNLEFTHENNERPNIHLVERLFASSLVALVSSDHPRKLDVCHFKKGSEICNYSYSNAILAVKLNRMRLVVCLEESLYIHNIRDMKVLHTIRDTPPNPKGICALSPHNEHAYLAYPGSVQAGEVQIFDTTTLRAVINISAHDNPLAGVSFNQQGTRLATASEKGTVIRVFSLPDGAKLFEFRRGLKRCADIHCLAFSVDSLFLCVCSNTETVHIFKLEEMKEKPQEDGSWMGMLNSAIKSSASYFPPGISDVMNQGRSFATARLPAAGLKSVCTITALQKIPRLLVATHEGHLYIYNIDPNEGGECTLLKTHTLEGQSHDHSAPADDSAVPSSSATCDRPLTQQSSSSGGGGGHQEGEAGESYAATVRRPPLGGSPSTPSGKLVAPPSGGGVWQTQQQQRAGDKSYAAMLRGGGGGGGGGPQHIEPKMDDESEEEEDELDPLSLMDEIMNEEGDSLPYQDPMDGAIGGEDAIGALRLQDDSEFPPVSHKSP